MTDTAYRDIQLRVAMIDAERDRIVKSKHNLKVRESGIGVGYMYTSSSKVNSTKIHNPSSENII